MEKSPGFRAGCIAMKIPTHEWDQIVRFYKDILGLPLGDIRLWLDKADHLSQAEIWLEIQTENLDVAAEYLQVHRVVRRDEIEALPKGFKGFWISNPANIIHLVSGE